MATWHLEFRTKFYVDASVTRAWGRQALHLLFLQLREDLAIGRCVGMLILILLFYKRNSLEGNGEVKLSQQEGQSVETS